MHPSLYCSPATLTNSEEESSGNTPTDCVHRQRSGHFLRALSCSECSCSARCNHPFLPKGTFRFSCVVGVWLGGRRFPHRSRGSCAPREWPTHGGDFLRRHLSSSNAGRKRPYVSDTRHEVVSALLQDVARHWECQSNSDETLMMFSSKSVRMGQWAVGAWWNYCR